jgi:ribonuclease HII
MFDLKFYRKTFKTAFSGKVHSKYNQFFMAGTDEVGRGPLAGPVVAACVSLHFKNYEDKELKKLLKNWEILGINDSKKITHGKRQAILSEMPFSIVPININQIYTHHYSKNIILKILIKEISPKVIDEINILNASLKAMEEAVHGSCEMDNLGLVLIDGNKKFKAISPIVHLEPIVKGDSKSLLIGLASIVAKEYRDQLMKKYNDIYPGYSWSSNAGYGTAKHLEAIGLLGITDIHRKTFAGVKEYYEEGGSVRANVL